MTDRLYRLYRLGMNDEERAMHVTGTGIDPRKPWLNLTVTMEGNPAFQDSPTVIAALRRHELRRRREDQRKLDIERWLSEHRP